MKSRSPRVLLLLLMLTGVMPRAAMAADFSFTGNFSQDDDIQLFNFVVAASSNVTLRTWSYAGGVNAAGASIPLGGFDPILALFDSTGALIDQNDDGGCGVVDQDPATGVCYDTFLTSMLAAGTYTVSVMQYDNFAVGPNLSDGFTRSGQGDFTGGFVDVTGSQRDSHWAFDVLNVEDASTPPVPEPSTVILLLQGVAGLGIYYRRKRRS